MQGLLDLITSVYQSMGMNQSGTEGDLFGLLSVLLILGFSAKNFLESPDTKPSLIEKTEKPEEVAAAPAKVEVPQKTVEPAKVEKPKVSWTDRLRKGLSQSRQEVWGKISSMLGGGLTDDIIEEIEELLYSADIGSKTVSELIDLMEQKKAKEEITPDNFREFIYDFLKERLAPFQTNIKEDIYDFSKKETGTKTIMIVGVNGVGKTTTIGKLATRLTRQGAKVVVGAGDTFRAAAVDQLQVWCERSGAEMIRAEEGANPSGVVYDAVGKAVNGNADYCIIDTAGRLHTNANLMQELVKIKNVMAKHDDKAPQEVWLVLDAITGQNALRQAKEFNEALGLTGVIFTKCDGSSKAGSAVQIVQELKVPILYIGVGEDVDDLDQFKVDDYLAALIKDDGQMLSVSVDEKSTFQVP